MHSPLGNRVTYVGPLRPLPHRFWQVKTLARVNLSSPGHGQDPGKDPGTEDPEGWHRGALT
jgi:hypothetical protein